LQTVASETLALQSVSYVILWQLRIQGFGRGVKMKRNPVTVVIAVVFALISAVVVSAQKTGDYREIDKADEGAVAAAEFAVKDQSEKKELTYKLVSVAKAETQVVAGINYRLCLKISYRKQNEDADTTEFVRVVVFRSLQKEYSLTSWTEEECSKEGDPELQLF
jgi:hypothetical protein